MTDCVSVCVNQALVEVNEEGAVAAAVTEMLVCDCETPVRELKQRFIADHPFIFFIIDDRSRMVMFMGRFVQG